MIYSRFHGRIGNQMFQYAAGLALARHLGTELVIDDRWAHAKGMGSILTVFPNLEHKLAPMPPARHDAPFRYLFWRYLGGTPKLRREDGLAFNTGFFETPDDSYLHGYWQSPKYFDYINDLIVNAFTLPQPEGQNADVAAEIDAGLAVSLHVRRGDYLQSDAHGVCGQTYYDRALATLRPLLPSDPKIFVFSDDPDWARTQLKLPFDRQVVSHNSGDTDFEDLRLMSLCDHHITANSSFSWWAAWLNRSPGKQVIAPTQWFADPDLVNPDMLPSSWITVPNT